MAMAKMASLKNATRSNSSVSRPNPRRVGPVASSAIG
jgi:hypothetical protein